MNEPLTSSRPSARLTWWIRLLGVVLTTGLSGSAAAEGRIQLQLYSVPAPLTPLDSISLSFHYQVNPGQGPNAVLDLRAERASASFGVRYSNPHHSLQVTGKRSTDVQAGRAAASATATYTYIPSVPPDGLALTSATLLYTYSGNDTPTYSVGSHTVGVNAGVRFDDHVTNTTTATVSAVLLTGQPNPIWNGNVSSSLVYAQDKTVAYLVPSVSVQSGQALWSVTGGASGSLASDLTAKADASWSTGAAPNVNAALTYTLHAWQFATTARYSNQNFSVGAGARVSLPDDLILGTHIAVIPATLATTYSADLSKVLGGVRFNVTSSLNAPPDAGPTFSVQTSVSGQKKPWNGNLNLQYTHSPTATTGSATGTLGYTAESFGAQVSLGLNLNTPANAQTIPTGQAEASVSYNLTRQLALSGSVKYERSVAVMAAPSYRYGIGLIYLFDQKEP